MALGSNRDYVKTHRLTMERLKKAGLIKLWLCPNCGRRNAYKEITCPRCHEKKENATILDYYDHMKHGKTANDLIVTKPNGLITTKEFLLDKGN